MKRLYVQRGDNSFTVIGVSDTSGTRLPSKAGVEHRRTADGSDSTTIIVTLATISVGTSSHRGSEC